MDEKIIIQEKVNKKTVVKPFSILGILVALFALLYLVELWIGNHIWEYYYDNHSLFETLDSIRNVTRILAYFVMFAGAVCLFYWIAVWLMSKCEIAVTSHRVYGRSWKGQVDLPIDSVSAVKMGMFNSVVVATSSGKVSFSLLKQQKEIFNAVSTLLKERQNKSVEPISEKKNASVADELKEYKSLLDAGIITQEEFDAKKKQLLGL